MLYLFAFIILLFSLIIYGLIRKSNNIELIEATDRLLTQAERNTKKDEYFTHGPSNRTKYDWNKKDFKLMKKEGVALYKFVTETTKNPAVAEKLDMFFDNKHVYGSRWSVAYKSIIALLMDVYKTYKGLGYKIDKSTNEEIVLFFYANYILFGFSSQFTLSSMDHESYDGRNLLRRAYDIPILTDKELFFPKSNLFIKKYWPTWTWT